MSRFKYKALLGGLALYSMCHTPLSFASPGSVKSKPQRSLRANSEETLTKYLRPDAPTIFFFYRPSSSLERDYLEALQKDVGEKVGIVTIALKSGVEPLAAQYKISDTPSAIIYDRRGRQTGQTSDAAELRKLAKQAGKVMRIDWPLPGDPRFDNAAKMFGGGVPDILHTMLNKPEYMESINKLSRVAHFSDGFLKRKDKEMIATYVSALNKCKY